MAHARNGGNDGSGDSQGGGLGGLVPSSSLAGVALRARDEALARLGASESLESAYEAWGALREALAQLERRGREESERLERQAAFLVGAVKAAEQAPSPSVESAPALVPLPQTALAQLAEQAEARISEARQSLARELQSEKETLQQTTAEARAEVLHRVSRFAAQVRPSLELWHRPLGRGERTVLHLGRPSPDASVLLFWLLTGCAPSRYGYLADEATEDLHLGPPLLYPDEGVPPDALRPEPGALRARVLAVVAGQVLPVRGFIPVLLGDRFYRLLQRGPVLELEIQEGQTFRSMLLPEEAEAFAGLLLRLRLQGRVQLELRTD